MAVDETKYLKDHKGRLNPIERVKEIDLLRNDLVNQITSAAEQLNQTIADFKNKAFRDIYAFVELSLEKYGTKRGGTKGNLSLISYDGSMRITVAIAECITFDERLQAAKALIDECLIDWMEGGKQELRAIVMDAFDIDKQGNINVKKILNLRRIHIEDERWKRAMDAISDSLQVVGSKSYIRIYKRIPNTEEFVQIPLDISAI